MEDEINEMKNIYRKFIFDLLWLLLVFKKL